MLISYRQKVMDNNSWDFPHNFFTGHFCKRYTAQFSRYTVWVKKNYPLRLLSIFAKRLGIFNWNFAHLLRVQIYDRLSNFIQLSPNFTKLCCIKRDYPRILSLSLLENINFLITYLLPDLNPLDYHVWGAMLQAFHKIHPKPKTISELKSVLQQIWDGLPQTTINKAINDFRKRLNACVAADGGHFEHTMWSLCRWMCCNGR